MVPSRKRSSVSKTGSALLSLHYGAPPKKRDTGGARPNAMLLRALRLLFSTVKEHPASERSGLLSRLSPELKRALLSFAEKNPNTASVASARSEKGVAAAVGRSPLCLWRSFPFGGGPCDQI